MFWYIIGHFFVLLVFTVSATNIKKKPLTLQYVLNFGMNLVLHHLSCGHGFITQIRSCCLLRKPIRLMIFCWQMIK